MKLTCDSFCSKILMGAAVLSATSMAAETLFSNDVFNVNETGSVGSLWAFSRGQVYSGVTRLNLDVGSSGNVLVTETSNGPVEDTVSAVQEGVFSDVLAEHRRTPAIYAGSKGYVLPMLEMNDDGAYLIPSGFFSISDVDDPVGMELKVPDAYSDLDSIKVDGVRGQMAYAVSAFAFDSSSKNLWIARGAAGLGLYSFSGSSSTTRNFALNSSTATLDTAKSSYKWDEKKNPSIYGLALHPETGDLWMATSKGMWIRTRSGDVKKASSVLNTDSRVTGVWIGGDPLQIIAETSSMEENLPKGSLWRLAKGSADFAKVDFLDTAGKKQKRDIYDDGDYTVSSVTFLGENAFVGVVAVGGTVSGYFKLDSKGARAWEMDDDGKSSWLYGYETGATDRDVVITSICSFPLTKNIRGLALSTYGNGISVSADSGKTWTPILNRAKLGNDLGSVRMVPSVITAGDQALVSYKVSKNSKITIDVFSYDMKKVKTIVKDAPREADASRSTNPRVDFWDGFDKHGRACSMGVYYVRVKDNHGHIGWGKVMTLGGHK